MIQIAKIPYRKTYRYPYLSDSMAMTILVYALVLILPFFLVFSVHNFYLSYTDDAQANPTIAFTYQYQLAIETSSSSYLYSSLYQVQPSRAITFSYEYDELQLNHNFGVKWPKLSSERVTRASLLVLMQYSTSGVQDAIGMVEASGEGLDIATLSIVGFAHIRQGQNPITDPPTTSILQSNNYDIQQTFTTFRRDYSMYLGFETSGVAHNAPSNMFEMNLRLKSPTHSIRAGTPTILGQLVWSFSQYFPVALMFWLVGRWVLAFFFRENLLRRSLVHEGRVVF